MAPLSLLVVFGLLILSTEGRGVQEELSPDFTAGSFLRGKDEHLERSRLIPDQLLHNEKVLDASLVGSDQQTMADRLQSAAEVSPCSTQEVLVPTRSTDPSDGNTRQENGSEPQQRLPVSRKLYNQTVCGSEPDQQNPQMDQVLYEADPVLRASRTPRTAPSPDDPLVQFDQQQIVMLADDEVVRTAAASLFHKHPAVSSLHAVRPRHRVRQVKGQAAPLSERSSLVLVGHGAREPSGEMRISGYSYQDVARIIQSSSRIGQKIQTTAVVACGAGSDRRFPQALLQTLHRAGLETELHLWETAVQVAETGDVLSQDGARWRSGDHSKKLVLTVGRTGEIRRRDDRRNCTGQEVDSSDRGILGKGGKDGGKQKDEKRGEEEEGDSEEQISIYRRIFPDHPQRFINVDENVFEEIDQNVETVKKAFWELESVTWGLFYSEPDRLQTVDVDHDQINGFRFILRKKTPGNNRWINDQNELRRQLDACFVITSGRDIRNIIRQYADHGEDRTTYLMVNDWIFEVNLKDLYVYPAGKRLTAEENGDQVKGWIDLRDQEVESYPGIKSNIPDEGRKGYVFYVKGIFGLETLKQNPSKTEMFVTWYFTASVISESARNFRTFPLTLMALDINDKDILFNRHPMADGGTWIDPEKRGFEGAAKGNSEKLKEVLKKEYAIFKKWREEAKKKYDPEDIAALTVKYEIFPDGSQFMEGYNNFKANTKLELETDCSPSP